MSLDLTIAIPTYNGAERLPLVLDKLRSQINPEQYRWEIIVVDNNSTDHTANLIQSYQANWSHSVPLKYVFEPRQGIAFARQQAVQEAQGALIAFLDDDNLPAPDWIREAITFAQHYPQAGAFSGRIHGAFEIEPPPEFRKIQQFLAIRDHGETPQRFQPGYLRLPPGAGLVVRKQAWCESVPEVLALSNRTGQLRVGGEDYEALLHLHQRGWEIWYNPAMQLNHSIPHQRLQKKYLISLAYATGLATCQLRMIMARPWQKPFIMLKMMLSNLHRILRHWMKYRQSLKNSLVPAFEIAFYWGCFNSIFHYFKLKRSHNHHLASYKSTT